jgi:hypothetical protein
LQLQGTCNNTQLQDNTQAQGGDSAAPAMLHDKDEQQPHKEAVALSRISWCGVAGVSLLLFQKLHTRYLDVALVIEFLRQLLRRTSLPTCITYSATALPASACSAPSASMLRPCTG